LGHCAKAPVNWRYRLGAVAREDRLCEAVNDLGVSIARVAAGFAIALVLAIVLGSVVGGSRAAERALDPTLQAIRAVPSLAWVPLILLWLGIGETAKITLVAIGAFFPIYVALVSGIRGVDRKLVEVGTMFGLSRPALIA